MGTENMTPETRAQFSPSENENSFEWTSNDTEHMKLEKECRQCEQSFTTNVPRTWVKEDGSLDTHTIKDMDIDPEAVQHIVENDVSENCKRNS